MRRHLLLLLITTAHTARRHSLRCRMQMTSSEMQRYS